MVEQLHHMRGLAELASVPLGVVPLGAGRTMWLGPSFWIFDNKEAQLETHTAALTITQPYELAVYQRVFEVLSAMAVRGREAGGLIDRASSAFN